MVTSTTAPMTGPMTVPMPPISTISSTSPDVLKNTSTSEAS